MADKKVGAWVKKWPGSNDPILKVRIKSSSEPKFLSDKTIKKFQKASDEWILEIIAPSYFKTDTSDLDALFNIQEIEFMTAVNTLTTCENMFSLLRYCTDFKNIEYVINPSITAFGGMFNYCDNLKDSHLSFLYSDRFSKTFTSMNGMFYNCGDITTLNTADWDVTQVTNFHSLFENCSSLNNLDLSSWNPSSAEDLSVMFGGCSSLQYVDISNITTQNLIKNAYYKGLSRLFDGCHNLQYVYLPADLTTTQPATDMRKMFKNCYDLTCFNLLDTTNAISTVDMFLSCNSLTAPDSTTQDDLLNGASWTNPNSCP